MTTHSSDITRRHGLRLMAAGTAAAGLAALSPAHAGPASPHPLPTPGEGIEAGVTAHVAVSAATAWVEPGAFRPGVDEPSLRNPVDLDAWNTAMEDTETRRWLTGELETQSVLGGEVVVDDVRDGWAHVLVTAQGTPRDERGYPGWMPVGQLVVDPRFAQLTTTAPVATVVAKRSTLAGTPSGRHPGIPVSFDTRLPVLGRTGRSVEVAVPGGGSAHLPLQDVVVREQGEEPPAPTAEDIIATGERFLGLRYLWAGVSAWGYDCSGYTYTLLRHHGIRVDRDAGDQMHHSGLDVVERPDLQRGDLVFFATEPGGDSIRHVAVYLGEDRIMHAPNASRSVEVVSLTEYDPTGEYAGARRAPLAG